jgi:short subunit dehydrogenase-like uncharacterized protein
VTFVLYGAAGYTGRLVAREAVARGHRPVLAGRDAAALARLGAELGLPHRTASLDDPDALNELLDGAGAVLHCAGPFAGTWRPMVEACLRRRVHYLDITGEIEVFENLARLDADARTAGIVLLPGTGFDVVPSDCLARHLKDRLPTATTLVVAFQARGGMSRGTALTTVRNLGRPGAVRRDGRITPVPGAWKTREVDFGRGPRLAVTIPWGDVATAWYSTGIGNIEVYVALGRGTVRLLRGVRWLAPVLASRPVRGGLAVLVRRGVTGPSEEARRTGGVVVWGEVTDGAGGRAASRLRGPEGYTMTALTAVRAVEGVMAGSVRAGFQTPARAFGADFVLSVPGVTREDLP